MNKHTDEILNNAINLIIDAIGTKETELLIDISWRRCLVADRDHYKERRVYMHTGHEPLTICVSSSIEILDSENLYGLFFHELGHIIHKELPEIYKNAFDDDDIEFIESCEDDEIIADFIISVCGVHIFYDENKVQWVRER